MKIIDISGVIENGMWWYGDPIPDVQIKAVTTLDSKRGEANYRITVSHISGTYVETGAHRLPGFPGIDQVPIERLYLDAAVVKVGKKRPLSKITAHELEASAPRVRKGDALIVAAGWDRMWNKPGFVEKSPFFTADAADWIIGKGVSLLGSDLPCFDSRDGAAGIVNRFFEAGMLIMAPLVNLDSISKPRVKLLALPPRVKGVCGFPCRVVVFE